MNKSCYYYYYYMAGYSLHIASYMCELNVGLWLYISPLQIKEIVTLIILHKNKNQVSELGTRCWGAQRSGYLLSITARQSCHMTMNQGGCYRALTPSKIVLIAKWTPSQIIIISNNLWLSGIHSLKNKNTTTILHYHCTFISIVYQENAIKPNIYWSPNNSNI